jgi:hypothetical protein
VSADETSDEGRPGFFENLPRRTRLPDVAGFHDDHQVGERHGLVLAMGHMHEADAEIALQALQFTAHVFAQERIERRKRLVEQQNLRPRDEGARQRDALLLTARQLRRQPIGKVAHPDEFQELARARPPLDLARPANLEAVGHVIDRRHMRK